MISTELLRLEPAHSNCWGEELECLTVLGPVGTPTWLSGGRLRDADQHRRSAVVEQAYRRGTQSHVAVSFEEPEYTADSDAIPSATPFASARASRTFSSINDVQHSSPEASAPTRLPNHVLHHTAIRAQRQPRHDPCSANTFGNARQPSPRCARDSASGRPFRQPPPKAGLGAHEYLAKTPPPTPRLPVAMRIRRPE